MGTREEKQQLIRTKFDVCDVEFFEEVLQDVQDLFKEQYENIKSTAGWERNFHLLNNQENAGDNGQKVWILRAD